MKIVRIKEILCPLRGGAGSVLASCDDGLFVIKQAKNRQGPNLLANELIGTVLMRAVGLPVPDWSFAIDESGILDPTHERLHFASRFLQAEALLSTFEVLPRRLIPSLVNRADFIGAQVFDYWAYSADVRQALFLEEPRTCRFRAVFIDQGHLFGGPSWEQERFSPTACFDPAIYTQENLRHTIDIWVAAMQRVIPSALSLALDMTPSQWHEGNIIDLSDRLMRRLDTLHFYARQILHTVNDQARPSLTNICKSGVLLELPHFLNSCHGLHLPT